MRHTRSANQQTSRELEFPAAQVCAKHPTEQMKVLVIDIGGTHIKLASTDNPVPVKVLSGPSMTAKQMVADVLSTTAEWQYEAISIGYPGPVTHDRPLAEPHNLATGWVGFPYQAAFPKPVRFINDAAMQALGGYTGGKMLFLGIGTGLGSALIVDNVVVPLELAHLPYKNGRTYEEYIGLTGLERRGKKKWRASVLDIVARLRAAFVADYVVLGGGNAKLMRKLPDGVLLGANSNAIAGGFALWQQTTAPVPRPTPAPEIAESVEAPQNAVPSTRDQKQALPKHRKEGRGRKKKHGKIEKTALPKHHKSLKR